MDVNQKSKKQVAQDYFASLDASKPFRERVDDLVEYMKIEFVNGQTERVVFNYIRDKVSVFDMPTPNAALMKEILRHKFRYETNAVRGVYAKDRNAASTWEGMTDKAKFSKLLSLVDLYETDKCFQLSNGDYASNKGHVGRGAKSITYGSESSNLSDDGNHFWFSKYSKPYDLTRNHFPFFTREQLENAISSDDIIDISKEFLSDREISAFQKLLGQNGSAKSAYASLKRESSSNPRVSSAAAVKNSGSGGAKVSSGGGPDFLGWIFIIGLTLLVIKCASGDPNQGKSDLQRKADIVCEAAGGCSN